MISEARASALAWNCNRKRKVSKSKESETGAFSKYLGRRRVNADALPFLPGGAVGRLLNAGIIVLLLLVAGGDGVDVLHRLLLALEVSGSVGGLEEEGFVGLKTVSKSAGFRHTFGYFSFSPFSVPDGPAFASSS